MIPVFQTRFGRPLGNCWAASIASILELPLSAVDWAEGMTAEEAEPPGLGDVSDEWVRRQQATMRGLGYTILRTEATTDLSHEPWYPWLHYLGLGETEMGTGHVVVMRGGEIVHDPHPGGVSLADILFYEFLIRG